MIPLHINIRFGKYIFKYILGFEEMIIYLNFRLATQLHHMISLYKNILHTLNYRYHTFN